MKSFFILILLSLTLLPNLSQAQGIDGRRITINYNPQLAASYGKVIDYLNQDKLSWQTLYLDFEAVHLLELNFLLSKSWSMGPDIHYFNLKTLAYFNNPGFLLKNRGFGFHIQKFNYLKGGIAPVGSWTKIRIYQNNGEVTLEDGGAYAGSYRQIDLSVSVGKQISIMKYFLVNVGIGMDFNNAISIDFEENTFITQNDYESHINQYLIAHQIVFLNLGIGWNVGL